MLMTLADGNARKELDRKHIRRRSVKTGSIPKSLVAPEAISSLNDSHVDKCKVWAPAAGCHRLFDFQLGLCALAEYGITCLVEACISVVK